MSKPAPKAAPGGGPVKGKMNQDTDGTTAAGEEQQSVRKVTRATAAGKTQAQLDKEWKQAVMQRLKDLKKTNEVNYLNSKNWLGDQTDAKGNLLDPSGQGQALDGNDAFGDLWQHGTPQFQAAHPNASTDEVYHGYTWGTSAHNPGDSHLAGAMAGVKKTKKTPGRDSLMDDPAFQTITSVQRKQADGTKASPNPLTDNYAVGARAGDLVKVTYPDGSVHYMPADDTNPHASLTGGSSGDTGEMSTHAMYGSPAGTSVTMQPMGRLSNPLNGDHLSNDEWDEIGSNNYRNPDGTIPNTKAQLDAARTKAGKAPPAPPKTADAGGPKLLQGFPTVMHGADARNIGYANNDSVHAAGGYMKEGSNTVLVGPQNLPVSRVGDGTSDGLVAVSGADDLFVGGGTASV
jgi:hypothetical protein